MSTITKPDAHLLRLVTSAVRHADALKVAGSVASDSDAFMRADEELIESATQYANSLSPNDRRRLAGTTVPPTVADPTDRHTDAAGWCRGYASALGDVWRCFHEGDTIRKVMVSGGISIAMLEAGGASPYDLDALRAAIAPLVEVK